MIKVRVYCLILLQILSVLCLQNSVINPEDFGEEWTLACPTDSRQVSQTKWYFKKIGEEGLNLVTDQIENIALVPETATLKVIIGRETLQGYFCKYVGENDTIEGYWLLTEGTNVFFNYGYYIIFKHFSNHRLDIDYVTYRFFFFQKCVLP